MAVMSLGWRLQHDSPIMLYIAYLIENLHYVPYKDIFDMNMPGTFMIHISAIKIFGPDDIGWRHGKDLSNKASL